MPAGSILLGLALLIVVVPFVAVPLVNGRRRTAQAAGDGGAVSPRDVRLARQSALAALRDLDFDFRLGKIAEEDYPPLRQRLVAEAAQALQADEAAPSPPDCDAEIEAAVRARRASRVQTRQSRCARCHTPVDEGDKFCSTCGTARDATCPQCHDPVRVTDRFCARCGEPLHTEVVPVS